MLLQRTAASAEHKSHRVTQGQSERQKEKIYAKAHHRVKILRTCDRVDFSSYYYTSFLCVGVCTVNCLLCVCYMASTKKKTYFVSKQIAFRPTVWWWTENMCNIIIIRVCVVIVVVVVVVRSSKTMCGVRITALPSHVHRFRACGEDARLILLFRCAFIVLRYMRTRARTW